MAFQPLVIVAGIALPEPADNGYHANTGTFVDGARNTEGNFIGSVIRDDVAKVDITWRFLTIHEWSNILKLFRIKSGGKFVNTVTFFCQDTATYETRDMYVSDRGADAFLRDRVTGDLRGWTGCKLSLIEA